MPGLPAVPNAERIDIDNEGRIQGCLNDFFNQKSILKK
jgi:hypothetical protein